MPSLSALKNYGACPTGKVLLGAWYEVAESGQDRGNLQIRQLLSLRMHIMLHAGPCPVCHGEVERWGGWHRLEDALNPIAPTAEPEE